MTHHEHVKEIFIEHHSTLGMDIEEAEDVFNETSFQRVERWLTKLGYDLNTKILA